ncbi:MAG: hypothetical protein FJ267_03175 [Planctomycetes bacterium]|nr:hypothetical protein [Planctomycetota bacterium]
MPEQPNEKLNELVGALGCSLLQFVGEVSPWSPTGASAVRATVDRLVRRQRQDVELLANLLVNRRIPVDFGVYPAVFTDLHFMSLKWLLPKVTESQTKILSQIDSAVKTCQGDLEAETLLHEILASQKSLTDELKTLSV